MLVLTRKVGDVIAIGDNVKIIVMSIRGKQVRLGIQADRNTVVHREEVYQKIQQEIRAAMDIQPGDAERAGEILRNASLENTGEGESPASDRNGGAIRVLDRPSQVEVDGGSAAETPTETSSSGVRIRRSRPKS